LTLKVTLLIARRDGSSGWPRLLLETVYSMSSVERNPFFFLMADL
jgi:hypothetical protein